MVNYKTLILVLSVIWCQIAHSENAYDIGVIPSNSSIDGIELGDWGAKWWQWAFSFDTSNSPVSDYTGVNCSLGQEGDVWFLAGGYTTSPIVRHCTIPSGKTLFFPIINAIYYPKRNRTPSCESVTQNVREIHEYPSDLYLSLDSTTIPDPYVHREHSTQCFDAFKGRLPAGSNDVTWGYPASSDGYWVAIKPLTPGKHLLKFGGAITNFSQNITYYLTIE